MEQSLLKQAVESLLEPGIYKTAAQVAAELKMEYPQIWQELEKEAELKYGTSCSALQEPHARIAQVLLSLPADCRQTAAGRKEVLWGLKCR